MRIECEQCRGDGEIPCPECNGSGGLHGDIESMRLNRSMKNYAELRECQKDAQRVIGQAERLKQLRPSRASSYDAQLTATLSVINREAERLTDRK